MEFSCKFSLANPLTWVLQQVPQGYCRFRIPWVGSDLHVPSHAGVREPVTLTGLGGASKAGPRVCLLLYMMLTPIDRFDISTITP